MRRDEDGGVGERGPIMPTRTTIFTFVLEPQMLAQIVFTRVTLFSIL